MDDLNTNLSVILMPDHPKEGTTNSDDKSDVIHTGRLGEFSTDAARYTSSIDIDPRILDSVVEINLAHVLMLQKHGMIQAGTGNKLVRALSAIPLDLKLNPQLEDVHMNVEDYVIRSTGKDIGGALNLGKSRNDQVATALRMTLRESLLSIMRKLASLEEVLVREASKNASTLVPGYTHLQRAQPVTLGHYLLCHEEALERDMERLFECFARVNKSPMGAGALASSGLPLDRKMVSTLLGFDGLVENSLDAVSTRDFAIESIYVCAQIMSDLSSLAEELILWTTREFSFAVVSDRFAATSSMMPQKKNAIVPEVARARCSQVAGDLVASLGLVKALPLSYNLDLQELTRNLWSATDKTEETLDIFSQMIRELKFNKDKMAEAVRSDETLLATELADYLFKKYGLSFREAHQRVGSLIKHADGSGFLLNAFSESREEDLRSILGIGISKTELSKILNTESLLSSRRTIGAPNPRYVKQSCRIQLEHLEKQRTKVDHLEDNLSRAHKSLRSLIVARTGRGGHRGSCR
jgi:argininosuccinate lyase